MDDDNEATLEHRIDRLEQWRAAVEAVSARRQWTIPVVISVVGLLTAIVNAVFFIKG